LYIGAEYCPFCASERWSLIAALSRFGEFGEIQPMRSSSSDIFPDTPTFTFYRSQYASPYFHFVAVETATRDRAPLEQPSPEARALMTREDPGGAIPFIAIGTHAYTVGSSYDPGLLAGKSWAEIAAGLANASNPTTRAIVGNANYYTAAICRATGDQPTAVCRSQAILEISQPAR
jgi:hypothetical protein